jgi:hypothetical protein
MNLLDSFSILKDIVTLKEPQKKQSIHKLGNKVKDVYNSHQFKQGLDKIERIAKDRINKSRNPKKTGIINENIKRQGTNKKIIEHFGGNSDDSEFSDEVSLSSNSEVSVMGDPTLLISRANSMIDNINNEFKIVDKRNANDTFLNQYDSLKFGDKQNPASYNGVHKMGSISDRAQTERNLAVAGGYSNFGEGYGSDNNMGLGVTNDFSHINMVPQFKGKTYGTNPGRDHKFVELSQRKMENFTGTDNITFKQKTEQKPLFDPIMNATNIYGTPLPTDYLMSHYIPGREKRTEKPFQEKRITPGLNLGYNEQNPMGSNYRPQFRSIDDMRTASQQQISYTTPVVTSGIRTGGGGGRGPVIGEQNKNKPERTKEWGTDRHVKNFGYAIAPAIYGEFIKQDLATTNRGLIDRTLSGPAFNEVSQVTPDKLREKFEGSVKQNYTQAEPRNMILVEGMSEREDALKYIPDPTLRSQELDYVGPAGTSSTGRTVAHDPNDVLDPTLRDIHNRYDRDGVAIVGAYGKGHHYDPNDVPDPTRRNIHDRYDRDGQAIQPSMGKVHYFDPNDVPDPTRRNIHDRYDRDGVAIQPSMGKGHYFDPNEVPDVTNREIYSKLDRARTGAKVQDGDKGYAINYDLMTPDVTNRELYSNLDRANAGAKQQQADKGYAINYDLMTPDVTNRELYSNLDRARTGAKAQDGDKGYAINYDLMTPDVTNRELYSKLDRARTGAKAQDGDKGYAINYDLMTPDVTNRELYSKLDRARTGAKAQDGDKGYAINYDLMTPDVTNRELYSKLDRSRGGANGDSTYLPQRTRDDYLNANVNVGREQVEMTGRAPTLSNYDKGPSYDFTMLRTCEKLQINRDVIPSTIAINEKLPFVMSFSGSPLKTMENPNIDSFAKQNLNRNPYINNVVHKAM